jgi:hypothetical protein
MRRYGKPYILAQGYQYYNLDELTGIKDSIAMYQFTGASKATIDSAKATLMQSWNEYPFELVERQCRAFHPKCELVIRSGGKNNFNG